LASPPREAKEKRRAAKEERISHHPKPFNTEDKEKLAKRSANRRKTVERTEIDLHLLS